MPVAAPNYDPNERARQQAALRYDTPEAQLKRAIEQVALGERANEAGINTYGTSGRSAINETFDQLAGNLANNRQVTNQQLGTQVESIGSGYRQANQIQEQARSQASARLSELAGRLGFGNDVVAEASSPLEAMVAKLIGSNAQTDATRTGNLKNWAAQQDAIMREGEGSAQRDRSNRLSSFETELMSALAKNKNQASQATYDSNSSLLDLLNERGAFQANAANELVDQLFNQGLQAAQFNLGEAQAIAQESRASKAAADDSWKQQLALAQFQEDMTNGEFGRSLQLAQEKRLTDAQRMGLSSASADRRAQQEEMTYSRNQDSEAQKLSIASLLMDSQTVDNPSELLMSLGLMERPPPPTPVPARITSVTRKPAIESAQYKKSMPKKSIWEKFTSEPWFLSL